MTPKFWWKRRLVSFRSILVALPGAKHLQVELVLYLENESEMVVLHIVSDWKTVFKGDLEILLKEVYMLVLLAFF